MSLPQTENCHCWGPLLSSSSPPLLLLGLTAGIYVPENMVISFACC